MIDPPYRSGMDTTDADVVPSAAVVGVGVAGFRSFTGYECPISWRVHPTPVRRIAPVACSLASPGRSGSVMARGQRAYPLSPP